MKKRVLLSLITLSISGTIALGLSQGCSSIDPSATTNAVCPPFDDPATSFEDFRTVSAVIERRCGTMDCHGSIARPMRIYGQSTLRRPEDAGSDAIDLSQYFPGGMQPTTEAELEDNYRSICALEPEIMTAVVQGSEPVESLTFVRKPRLLEKHKGGRIWFEGDLGDTCLVSWLHSAVDQTSCNEELIKP